MAFGEDWHVWPRGGPWSTPDCPSQGRRETLGTLPAFQLNPIYSRAGRSQEPRMEGHLVSLELRIRLGDTRHCLPPSTGFTGRSTLTPGCEVSSPGLTQLESHWHSLAVGAVPCLFLPAPCRAAVAFCKDPEPPCHFPEPHDPSVSAFGLSSFF